jgi:hypothetical protein
MPAYSHSIEAVFAKSRVATPATIAHLKAEAADQIAQGRTLHQAPDSAHRTLIAVQFSESTFVPAIHHLKHSD